MKRAFLVLAVLCVPGCSKKTSLTAEDTAYIRTTMELLRARASFTPNEDSSQLKFSLDSVYRRDHTSAAEYQKQSAALANNPKHAAMVFDAINDSISKK